MPENPDDRGPQHTGEVPPQPNAPAWKMRKPGETGLAAKEEGKALSWGCGVFGIKSKTLAVLLLSIRINLVSNWISKIYRRSPRFRLATSN